MGSCASNPAKAEAKKRAQEIDKFLKEDFKKTKKDLKILLLGTAESGKSTVLKQFRIIFSTRFTDVEREAMRPTIQRNLFSSILSILTAHEVWELDFALPESDEAARVVRSTTSTIRLGVDRPSEEEVAAIAVLWNDPSIKECAAKGSEYNLLDSAPYFLDNISRISSEGYMPNDQDILRSRVITTVVSEFKFTDNGVTYRLYDVGGHRSARKTWVPFFDDCNAILFVVAVSSYNQQLAEDKDVNRIQEALVLFEAIVNHPLFNSTSIILFMNKTDLFAEKVKRFPIKPHFLDYEPPGPDGPSEVKHGLKFFEKKFSSVNRNPKRELFIHETCSTDTKQIKAVLFAVNAIIVNNNLRSTGL